MADNVTTSFLIRGGELDGHIWAANYLNEEYEVGEIVILSMNDNGTANAYDDDRIMEIKRVY